MEEIEMLAAPVKAFIRDCCNVGPGLSVNIDELWGTYQMWAERQGQRNPGTKNWFGRNLRSAEPGITTKKLREHDERERVYFGIEIKPEDDGLVELTVNVQHETLLEIYVHTSSGVVSLEKSFVSFYRKHNPVIAGGHADIRIPGWVARSKGLV
jgi:hypothetical protein